MTYNQQDVERIVIEVIRRLGLIGSPPINGQSELTIAERVVTLRSIEGRLAGVTRLRVQSQAVITPAVKDELSERHIELIRVTSP